MSESDLRRFEAEAVKLRVIAKCSQASALEAVGMARRANWRATHARILSVGAIGVALAATVLAYL